MTKAQLEQHDQLPTFIEKEMSEGFIAYEESKGISYNYKKFNFTLKSNAEKVIAGLQAYTVYAEVYIDDLWVKESFRGQGYSRKLLSLLESHFEGKGFNNMNLVTSAFQAPDFYKKCGFQEKFVRVNKANPQLSKSFFVKFFKNKDQSQGIL